MICSIGEHAFYCSKSNEQKTLNCGNCRVEPSDYSAASCNREACDCAFWKPRKKYTLA